MSTTRHVVIACLAIAVVASAAADDHAPTSLRMRDATAPAAPSVDDSAALSDDGKTEVIAETDSTIEHKLFTGRAPISVVTRADLAASGRGTLGEILQALPAQANAGNAQDNAAGDGTTRVNLRSLGVARTL